MKLRRKSGIANRQENKTAKTFCHLHLFDIVKMNIVVAI
jgi:hypothetical protein